MPKIKSKDEPPVKKSRTEKKKKENLPKAKVQAPIRTSHKKETTLLKHKLKVVASSSESSTDGSSYSSDSSESSSLDSSSYSSDEAEAEAEDPSPQGRKKGSSKMKARHESSYGEAVSRLSSMNGCSKRKVTAQTVGLKPVGRSCSASAVKSNTNQKSNQTKQKDSKDKEKDGEKEKIKDQSRSQSQSKLINVTHKTRCVRRGPTTPPDPKDSQAANIDGKSRKHNHQTTKDGSSTRRSHTRSLSRGYSPKRFNQRSHNNRQNTSNVRLHIKGLTRQVTKQHIVEIFGHFGVLTNVDFPMDRYQGRMGRGYAFVEYASPQDCECALKHMNGGQIDDKTVIVSPFQEKMLRAPWRQGRRFTPSRRRFIRSRSGERRNRRSSSRHSSCSESRSRSCSGPRYDDYRRRRSNS
ncbi:uncharacterized protein Dwil_GK19840 [Drosophila willistoni]|uniref:RRM domain-containing protein n=1 Tax=Drosophila willistoni TaxID=7260 RepID=B4MST2_DROWI|nr:uncharacterized protein Dwil_GK19840 [Drosophila willistoni]